MNHLDRLDSLAAGLAGLSLPGGPSLWELAQKSQVTPEVTLGIILQHH